MSDLKSIAVSGEDLLMDPAWDALVATAGNVFQTSHFLLSWWRDTISSRPGSELLGVKIMDGSAVIGACAFEKRDDTLMFAGGRNVVDYMGPAAVHGREKEVAEAVVRFAFKEVSWDRALFAGLVANDAMCEEVVAAIRSSSPDATLDSYDQVPRIDEAPDGYLNLLNSKRRIELLRKRKRLAEVVGKVEVVSSNDSSWPEALEILLAWKANASPAMGDFVAEYGNFMRSLMASLAPSGIGNVVELRAGERCLASAIVLSFRGSKLLYNMSYDLALAKDGPSGLSPGVVLVSHLVEEALDSGWRFDFLKGAQDYKLRLGGKPLDMVAITVER